MTSSPLYQRIAPDLKYLIYQELVSDSIGLRTQFHKTAPTSEDSNK